MSDINAWPALPPGVTGQQIRERKVYHPPMVDRPVRAGGAEPTVIVAETRQYVIYQVFSSRDGRDLGEHVVTAGHFESRFERRDLPRSYGNLRQEQIIDRYGWVGFLEHKVREYRHWKDANCGLLTYLGMTEDEYAAFALRGEVSARVKRVWS